jgi:hypothetical protein
MRRRGAGPHGAEDVGVVEAGCELPTGVQAGILVPSLPVDVSAARRGFVQVRARRHQGVGHVRSVRSEAFCALTSGRVCMAVDGDADVLAWHR